MKNLFKVAGIFLLTAFTIVSFYSCSRSDDPADNDFFAGTYKGNVSYRNNTNSTTINNTNGSVFVTKIASGTRYNFTFSDKIPDLNGVEFEKKGDNTLVSIGANDSSYIRIDSNKLRIFYVKDGQTWTADCNR
ncbi:hypothetical protein VO54_03905 [Elizabethkingia miricola]|nr:hypothetical protein VO54_03905 [Elizabethkingia miricola]